MWQVQLLGMGAKESGLAGRVLVALRETHEADMRLHTKFMCLLLLHGPALPNDRRRALWTCLMQQRYLRFDHLLFCRIAAEELHHGELFCRLPLSNLPI